MIQFIIATWFSFMLTNLSFAAMGIELRRRGVSIKWLSLSFNLTARFTKLTEVTKAYWAFKKDRHEFPVYAYAMMLFAAGILVIPVVGLLSHLLE